MKNHLMFLFLFLAVTARSQTKMQTIVVNRNFTATLNFSDSILFVVYGNNPPIGEPEDNHNRYYDTFKQGRSCIIRGNDSLAPETSINVKLWNGKIYYGSIRFGSTPQVFYNFEEDTSLRENTAKVKEVKEAVNVLSQAAVMKERLNSLMADPIQYRSLATIENNLVFQVANIKNDENFTYIKLVIYNKTGSDYNMDGIHFKYQEGKRRGVNGEEAKIEKPIKVELESPIKTVGAYKSAELGFIIQRFAVGTKGRLVIQLLELKGTRSPSIEVGGKDMSKVKVFENGLKNK